MTNDAQILAALRSAPSVSGEELAQQLNISRAAIWARIEELRQLGYEIEASPHHGYKLIRTPDLLLADDIESRLPAQRVIGREITVYKETASTNDVAERLARSGAREGLVIFAESQSKGRGRLGRRWVSPPGKGLWFSVLLRPRLRPQEATRLTVVAATALTRAVKAVTQVHAEIKWPNDLLVGGRKFAGVLTELSAEPDAIKHLILGIGIDVNLSVNELPNELRSIATSLQIAAGRSIPRLELAARILRELDHDYARLLRGEFEALADEWEERCTTIGRDISVQTGDRQIHGRAESLDPDGALLLRTQHGLLERIVGGDVTVLK